VLVDGSCIEGRFAVLEGRGRRERVRVGYDVYMIYI